MAIVHRILHKKSISGVPQGAPSYFFALPHIFEQVSNEMGRGKWTGCIKQRSFAAKSL